MTERKALVLGGGGFIGSHLARRLKAEGFWVRVADLKYPEFSESAADDFHQGDLCDPVFCNSVFDRQFDEVYQLAADMGGAGYIFTGDNDAAVMHNSATIILNVAEAARKSEAHRIFYSSSACIYPERNQLDPDNPLAPKKARILPTPTASMVGRNCSANASTHPMPETTA